MRSRRTQEPKREFPRDILLNLPSAEECCTAEETIFWNQTMQMAQAGKTPREVAEFAATGLDDPLLARAEFVIREAIRKWAAMGGRWQDFDAPPRDFDDLQPPPAHTPAPALPDPSLELLLCALDAPEMEP